MITSRTNQQIKNVKSLKDKKARDEQNVFVIEGIKLVNEALNSNFAIKQLFVIDGITLPFKLDENIVQIVSKDVFNSISSEISPQGVLAIVEKPKEKMPSGSSAILLDNVQDPSNVGAIIRSSASAGYNDIYLIESADPFSAKSVRASMGGIFKVNLHFIEREDAKKIIKLPFVVADMKGENIFNFTKKEKVCLVIGNEGNGVSQKIKEQADYTVSIPMENDMESLNASVSAGILMYLLKY